MIFYGIACGLCGGDGMTVEYPDWGSRPVRHVCYRCEGTGEEPPTNSDNVTESENES